MTRQPQSLGGFHSTADADVESNQAKPQPRVWEAQGTVEPEPESKASPQGPGNRKQQPSGSRSSQQVAQPSSHPSVRPVTQTARATETQKPASAPSQKQQNSHPPAPKAESGSATKKGH